MFLTVRVFVKLIPFLFNKNRSRYGFRQKILTSIFVVGSYNFYQSWTNSRTWLTRCSQQSHTNCWICSELCWPLIASTRLCYTQITNKCNLFVQKYLSAFLIDRTYRKSENNDKLYQILLCNTTTKLFQFIKNKTAVMSKFHLLFMMIWHVYCTEQI